MPHQRIACLIAALFALTGCITVSGDGPEAAFVPRGKFVPAVQHTVDPSFTFVLDGGAMITSNKAGREANKVIMTHWKDEGRIKDFSYVKNATQATASSDYLVILRGTQYGESNEVMQFFSGFTLCVLPYWVTTHFDLEYVVKERTSGREYRGAAKGSFATIVSLVLLPVTPFFLRAQTNTLERLGDQMYLQLAQQGAFQTPGGMRPPPPRNTGIRHPYPPAPASPAR